MKGIIIIKLILTVVSGLVIISLFNLCILHTRIDSIRQDIVELKKDYSYDPKDAK